MMLQQVERNTPILVDGYDLAGKQCTGRELFTCFGNVRELRRQVIAAPKPQRDSRGVCTSQAAIAVELHFISQSLPFGSCWTSCGYIGSTNVAPAHSRTFNSADERYTESTDGALRVNSTPTDHIAGDPQFIIN
jgi:hypothetical protein